MTGASAAPLAREPIDDFAPFGIHAFTTTRAAGSFDTMSEEPSRHVTERWYALRNELSALGPRFATARQVHGARIVAHGTEWEGWLRVDGADGHLAIDRGTAAAVTIADCVPVFIVHPAGATALLHSGWRGTVARILEHGIEALQRRGYPAREMHVHLGPAICGDCYQVSPEVYAQLTGRAVAAPATVDLRSVLADRARAASVRHLTISPFCTRHHNDRFFSHRAGDAGRQLGVLVAAS